MPEVSIVIPNFNHGRFLEERLNSIFNQTFQDFELIILDDASSDESLSIIEKFKNHPKVSHVVLNKQNSGSVFRQWVKGIGFARGEYIWIAESDDFCEEYFLEKTYLEIEKDTTIGMVFTASDIVYPYKTLTFSDFYKHTFNKEVPQPKITIQGREFIQSFLMHACCVPNVSAVLFRKEFITSSILKDVADYRFFGDWFFYLSILNKGNIVFLNESLNKFRREEDSHTFKINQEKFLKERSMILFEQRQLAINCFALEREYDKLYYRFINLFSEDINSFASLRYFLKVLYSDKKWARRFLTVLKNHNLSGLKK